MYFYLSFRSLISYPALLNDNVMETEQKCNLMFVPAPLANIPVLDEFPGKYNFQMRLNNKGAGKHCVVSFFFQFSRVYELSLER